jgi:2'-5' RNA ligase
VLWVGVSTIPDQLRQLHANIDEQLEREGFERETRKFSPHLTLGRIRAPHNSAKVAEALIATGFAAEAFIANDLILMRSDLKPTGSIYTPQTVISFS